MDRDVERHVTIGDQVYRGNIPSHVKSKMFLKIVKALVYSFAKSNHEKTYIRECIEDLYKEDNRIIFLAKHDGPANVVGAVHIDGLDYVPVDDDRFREKIGRTLREKAEKMMLSDEERAIADALKREWQTEAEEPSLPEKMRLIWTRVDTSPPVQKLRNISGDTITQEQAPQLKEGYGLVDEEGESSGDEDEDELGGLTMADYDTQVMDLTASDNLSLLFDDIMSLSSGPPPPVPSITVSPAGDTQALDTQNFDHYWSQLDGELGDEVGRYVYQYGLGIIGKSLKRLENAQVESQSKHGLDREAWAKNWALELSDDHPMAWQYNMDRKLCLKFLYRLIDKNLLLDFKGFRVDRIVRTCLVMDRANALYNMINHVTNTRGLHWFAEVDRMWMESLLDGPEEVQLLRKSRAPINRRLRALLDIPELGYRDDPDIIRWMSPAKAPSVAL